MAYCRHCGDRENHMTFDCPKNKALEEATRELQISCKICNEKFVPFDSTPYCSIDCQIKDGIYQDRIDYFYSKLVGSLDCGDSSCHWKKSGGMRTNGGCRCFKGMSTNKQQLFIESLMHELEKKYEK